MGTKFMKILFKENIALIEFDTGHRHNPFSGEKMDQLKQDIINLSGINNIRAVVLYGGKGNSFSVGGNFNEVINFSGGEEVEKWIDSLNSLYKTILSFPKPIIEAVDNYAIGFGMQLALVCDYRIGSHSCELKMPEFAMGIACNFGGYLIEKISSRNVMQEMLFGCEGIKGDKAKDFGLLHATTSSEKLLDFAIETAEKFAKYHPTPIKETKLSLNSKVIQELDQIAIQAKIAHKTSFASRTAQDNMISIIKKKA